MPNYQNTRISADQYDFSKTIYTDYRGYILQRLAIVFIALQPIGFALRVVARRMTRVRFGWDDALMIPSLPLNLGLCIAVFCRFP